MSISVTSVISVAIYLSVARGRVVLSFVVGGLLETPARSAVASRFGDGVEGPGLRGKGKESLLP